MRSFISVLAIAAAATQLVAAENNMACAMNALQTNTACESTDAACLCEAQNKENLLNQIQSSCGSEQGDMARSVAQHACNVQKARRALMPSASVVHMGVATPSATAAARMETPAEQQECSCANSPALGGSNMNMNMPSASAHAPNVTPSASGRMNAPLGKATGTPSSSARHSTPTGVDAFTPFRGAAVQILPSLSVSGALAAVVAVFAAL